MVASLSALAVLSLTVSLASLGAVMLCLTRVKSPPPAPPLVPRGRVSVLVPARDEENELEATLATLLAEGHPDLELVVVDDRSTDGTGAVLDRFAARDPRLRAVHVTMLPDGWLGKLHALEVASKHATGEWLVVMDADVQVAPGTFGRLVAHAEASKLDFITVLPRFGQAGFSVDASVAYGLRLIVTASRVWSVEDASSGAAYGFGALNLVRRKAFERTEGFRWLKLEVADDVGLGLMMKRAGGRCAVVVATDAASITFYRSLGELARRLEKNAWAILAQFSLFRLLAVLALQVGVELLPLLAFVPSLPPWARVVAGASFGVSLVSAGLHARWLGLPVRAGLAYPLGVAVLAFVQLRGGLIGWRAGGIRWRETFYGAETLRAGRRVSWPG